MNRRVFLSSIAGGLVAASMPAPASADLTGWTVVIEHGEGWTHPDELLLDFYFGDQWDAAVRKQRQDAGRPCLVFNRLPLIVDHILVRDAKPGIEASPEREKHVILSVTRRFRDAQVFYNYLRSAEFEARLDAQAARDVLLDPMAQYGDTPEMTRALMTAFEGGADRLRAEAEALFPWWARQSPWWAR